MTNQEIINNCLDYTLFSWGKQAGLNPLNAHTAKGVYITDREGKKYIDFSSQLMNVNIGHGNPKIAEAVAKQMSELSYVFPGMATEVRAKLGKKLAEISPGNLTKTFFTLGGAEAIDNAIKLARHYTGRHKIVTLYRSYHGASYGAISAGGDPRKLAVDSQQMPNIVRVDNPYFYRCPWYSTTEEECAERAADHLEQTLKYENPESVAAILMEGESGSSGCMKYPADYWQRVAAIAKKYGILTIDDEVMSGFGRAGSWFGIDNHGVEPDILVMAKGLTCGYVPLGGIIVQEKITKAYDEQPLPLGLTYSAHPVSCAAALATIQVYEDDHLIANAVKMGKYIESKVAEMTDRHPSIGDFRNTGLLGCIELVKNRKTKEPTTPWNAKPKDMEATNRMVAKVRELGMFTFVRWNFIFIAPPLCITESEIDEGLAILDEVINIADEYCVG